jgi:hypothetical protein
MQPLRFMLAVKLMTVLSMIIVTVNITVSTKLQSSIRKEFGELKKILKAVLDCFCFNTAGCFIYLFFSDSILVFF